MPASNPASDKVRVEDAAQRFAWFKSGLRQIAALPGLESVAFPDEIGCGLAGGVWADYRRALDEFCAEVEQRGVGLELQHFLIYLESCAPLPPPLVLTSKL